MMKALLKMGVVGAVALVPVAASAQGPASREDAMAAAAKRFAKLGANSNSVLTSEEIEAAAQVGKPKKKMGKMMFKRADVDGDGKVTLEEFKAAAGARYDKAHGGG